MSEDNTYEESVVMDSALGGVARKFDQDQWNAIEKNLTQFETLENFP